MYNNISKVSEFSLINVFFISVLFPDDQRLYMTIRLFLTLYPSNPQFSMTAIYLIIKSFLEKCSYGEYRKVKACLRPY